MALMYAYEQGQQQDGVDGRISAQAMGPDDSYICQTTTDRSVFWGDRNKLALGACFKPAPARTHGNVPKELIDEVRLRSQGDCTFVYPQQQSSPLGSNGCGRCPLVPLLYARSDRARSTRWWSTRWWS